MNQKLKNKRGITLIALVVTIVVLLILAGVSISLVLDNNGIIGKSKDARLETRASQVEDEIGLWKQSNFIKKESNQAQESADTVLASLISRKLLTEDEIDREQELIIIKKKDGSIVKEISYSSVTINISKSKIEIEISDTDKSSMVLLKVTSVDGLTTIAKEEEELNNFINSLSEDKKKEIIRNAYMKVVNNCTTFQDALDWAEKRGIISEATEDAFWTAVETSEEGLNGILFESLDMYYNKDTETIEFYNVANPDNEISNSYVATENGTYTFKVQDLVTGKTYTKKVEVNNIEASADNTYKIVRELDEPTNAIILLQNADTNISTTFEKAYIIYNNETINITETIEHSETYDYLRSESIADYLIKLGKTHCEDDIAGTDQVIIIIKDDKTYGKEINMGVWPR